MPSNNSTTRREARRNSAAARAAEGREVVNCACGCRHAAGWAGCRLAEGSDHE